MKVSTPNSEMPAVENKKNQPSFWWLKFSFFQEIFIYYWIAALIGHYLEVTWAYLGYLIFGGTLWQPINTTIIPLAPPYGFGAVAVLLLTWPLIKDRHLRPISVLALNVFITGAIEYYCAMFIVWTDGTNRYWNYSNVPFNLNGYTCLQASVIFGVLATLYLYFVYPFFKKELDSFKKKQFNLVFWVLFISYAVDLTHTFLT